MDTLRKAFAKVAYHHEDKKLVGKFIEIEQMPDGTYDLWLVKPDRSPIGTRKLNNLIAAMKGPVKRPFTVVNGEAWSSTRNLYAARKAGFLGGIRRARVYTDAQRQKLLQNLKGGQGK